MPSGEPVITDSQPTIGSGSLFPENPAPEGAATTPETVGTEATPAAGLNWDDPANPYIAQAKRYEEGFKGLQGTVQRYAEELKSVREAQKQAQEQQFFAQIQHLDPVSRQNAIQSYQAVQQVQEKEARLSEEAAAVENMAVKVFPMYLSQQYGVPVTELAGIDNPQEMEFKARMWKDYQDKLRVAQTQITRQAQGADNFGPTERSAAIPLQKSSDWMKAGENFAQALKRLR